jgi:hypothetical protein
MRTFLFFILLLLLFYYLVKNKETFQINIGQHLRFMKKNRTHNRLEPEDYEIINQIKSSYHDKTKYYDTINKINIPYLENPKKDKIFKKRIDYLRSKKISNLLPYHKN